MGYSAELTLDSVSKARDAFAEKMLNATAGSFEIFTIYIGDKLGLYEVLADDGALTPKQLSERTGTSERYVREWLEQQTVAGILGVENPEAGAAARRFYLPPGHAEVLVDRESLNYLAPLAQLVAGAVHPVAGVLDAFRTGEGVPYEDYGADLREGQARMNRAAFLYELGQDWLPRISDVHARLRARPTARIADVGCGGGWSSIGMALHYPDVRVDGFDLDAPSVQLARANAREAGVADRVRFQVRDAGDPELEGQYDLVTAFECVHDLSDPVSALRAMRRLANDDGAVLVMDERAGDAFTPTGNEIEWLLYGFSVLHCLPTGMADTPSAGTGTVMRAQTLRGYAREAGFRDVEILPIDHFLFRFYRLNS